MEKYTVCLELSAWIYFDRLFLWSKKILFVYKVYNINESGLCCLATSLVILIYLFHTLFKKLFLSNKD